MTFSIVSCGHSAQNWKPEGYSIGVNDSWKFGTPTDALLVCNRPQQFTPERLQTITNSRPQVFYSNKADWAQWFPKWKKVRLHTWSGSLYNWHKSDGPSAYSSNTSPIIAITLAYNLGAKNIILWGVDFKTHHLFNESNPNTEKEVKVYLEVFEQLKERGVSVYRGADGSVFDSVLPRSVTSLTNDEKINIAKEIVKDMVI